MQETGGNGIGRLVEVTGATVMINNCFTLLRFVTNQTRALLCGSVTNCALLAPVGKVATLCLWGWLR